MREMIKVFIEEMEKILDEKFDEKQDSWKEESLDSLGTKLQDQVSNYVLRNHLKHRDPKRTIIHVANYCLFIFTKLNE